MVERAHIVASLIPEYRWSDKRPEPDLRVISVIVCEEINKTIKLADSDYFPPQTFLSLPRHYPTVRTVSFRPLFTSLSFSCPLLFHPLPLKWNGGQVCVCSSVGVCGEPASLLFLMYENLCTLRGGGRRRKKGTQPRISTSSSVSLSFFLDACFLFTPFPPLFTRRLAPSPTPAKPLFFPSSFFLSPVSFPSFFAWIGRIERSRHPLWEGGRPMGSEKMPLSETPSIPVFSRV